MDYPNYPVALGVIRAFESPKSYDVKMVEQIDAIREKSKIQNMHDLLYSGSTWEVK
jgi:2-oxoglutarate/2-oxoacid ferredoxin oxidoreductase subunit beta